MKVLRSSIEEAKVLALKGSLITGMQPGGSLTSEPLRVKALTWHPDFKSLTINLRPKYPVPPVMKICLGISENMKSKLPCKASRVKHQGRIQVIFQHIPLYQHIPL